MSKDNEVYIKRIISELNSIDYIKPDDIPNIDLYMDQVTTFMDEHLKACKRYEDDKMLTKTMINNYTKNNLLPPPDKKKYSKEHMLLLIFIYYMKSFLSISDIQSIFGPLTERFYHNDNSVNLEDIYTGVFSSLNEQMDSLTKDVIRRYMKSLGAFEQVKDEEDRKFLMTFSCICSLSFDVYVKKMIIERIIDQEIKVNEKDKTTKKEEAAKKEALKKEAARKEALRKEAVAKESAKKVVSNKEASNKETAK